MLRRAMTVLTSVSVMVMVTVAPALADIGWAR